MRPRKDYWLDRSLVECICLTAFFLISIFLPSTPFLFYPFISVFCLFLLSLVLSFFLPLSHSFSHTPSLPRLPFALSPLSSSDGGHKSSCCQRARLVGLCNAAIHLEPEERTHLRPPSSHHVPPLLPPQNREPAS